MSTKKWFEKDPEAARLYDEALDRVRAHLSNKGRPASYDLVAQHLFAHTGEPIPGQTVRRWFQTRSIPVHWATSLIEITEGAAHILDFFPYLEGFAERPRNKDYLD